MSDNVVKDVSFLRQKSTNVSSASEAMEIIHKLENELDVIPNGAGLAAIQIGIPKRVAIVKLNGRSSKNIYLINTEIESKEEGFTYFKEGCLSFPDSFRNTKRYRHYTINNQSIENNHLVEEKIYFYYEDGDINSDGLTSIAVQHEMDHFDGKLIIDSKECQSIKSKPIVKFEKKVGRNDQCPCGSGKKYKKCCGR